MRILVCVSNSWFQSCAGIGHALPATPAACVPRCQSLPVTLHLPVRRGDYPPACGPVSHQAAQLLYTACLWFHKCDSCCTLPACSSTSMTLRRTSGVWGPFCLSCWWASRPSTASTRCSCCRTSSAMRPGSLRLWLASSVTPASELCRCVKSSACLSECAVSPACHECSCLQARA